MTVTRPALALCVLFLGTSVAVSAPSSIGTRRETKNEKSDPRRDDADSTVAGACRIEAGTTPDDFGEPNFCSESHQLTTQYVETQSIVFGTAANPSAPAVGMFKDTPLCPTECRMGADPPFTGDWWCAFALGTAPGVVGQQAFVSSFKANVCHVSIVMTMEALDRDFNVIDSASTNVFGGSDLTVNAPVGESIAYVRILSHLDENGVSIDCLEYPDPFLDDDADGVANDADNCPNTPNGNQADVDHDGLGDACDSDSDNDTVLDVNDNCRFVANLNQANDDHDLYGDACDNCPDVANSDQADLDGDGLGAACDPCDSAPPSARTWALPNGNSWENAAHWSPADVPDSPGESAIINSSMVNPIILDASVAVDRVSIFNPSAALHLHNETLTVLSCDGLYNRGSVVVPFGLSRINGAVFNEPVGVLNVRPASIMEIGGPTMANHGLFEVGGSVSALSVLRFVANTTLTGDGSLDMTDGSAMIETTGGSTFTNGPGHLLRGRGEVRGSMHNDGTVRADYAQAAILALVTTNKSNLGTLTATNGAFLDINAITVFNAGGLLLSDGGTVRLQSNAQIIGGVFETTGDSEVRSLNSTLTNIENRGLLRIASSTTAAIAGSWLQNEDVIDVGSGVSALVVVRFDNNIDILGSGRLEMLDGSSQLTTAPGVRVTNAGTHLIRGRGEIRAALDNAGVIRSDYSTASVLGLNAEGKSNTGTLTAANDAILEINGITLNNVGGLLLADGGTVRLVGNAQVIGGTFDTAGDSEVRSQNSILTDIENQGLLRVIGATTAAITGSELRNEAVIAMGSGVSAVVVLRFDNNIDIIGSGRLEMLDGSSQVGTAPGVRVTNPSAHLIRGRGEIRAAMDNAGVVRSDYAPATVLALFSEGKSNTGTISATNDAILEINGITLNNAGGRLLADGGTVRLVGNAQVIGGAFETIGDSEVRTQNAILTDIENHGLLRVVGGTTAAITGSELHNDGVIAVGSGVSALVVMRFDSNVAITGAGRLEMLDGSSQVSTAAGARVTVGPGQLIRGRGEIHATLTNFGIITADFAASQPLVLAQSSKTHHGSMRAENAAILQVSANVDGAGSWTAADGTLRVRDFAVVSTSGPIQVMADGFLDVQNGEMGGSDLTIDAGGRLAVAGRCRLSGNLTFASQTEADWNWGLGSSLIMTGGEGGCHGGAATLEVGARDDGPSGNGTNNFGIRDLTLAEGASVALVDAVDNGNRGLSGEPEALYATSLTLNASAVLDLNGLRLYVGGSQIPPGPLGLGVVIDRGVVAGVDGDDDMDLADLAILRGCLSGPEASYNEGCDTSDLDCDADVDLRDLRILQLRFDGGNN